MTPPAPRLPATTAALEDDRRDARSFRRALVNAAAILGVAPFLHAVAPQYMRALVHGVTALWSAVMLVWLVSTIEAQLVTHWQRPSIPPAE